MKLRDIYDYLDELSPFSLQEKWDNAGLIVGNYDTNIEEVYLSIDLDEKMLEKIKPNSLIITHHPLIFSSIKKVNFDVYSTKLLQILIKKDISLISMHTNIDKTHLNKYIAKNILDLDIIQSSEYIIYANVNMKFDDFLEKISIKLGLKYVKYVKCNQFIKKVALVTGAGMSLLDNVKADCFMTGDIKYHEAMDAKTRNISLIDIRHYESEQHFSLLLKGLLEKYLKKNKLQAIIMNSNNPFEFYIKGEAIE